MNFPAGLSLVTAAGREALSFVAAPTCSPPGPEGLPGQTRNIRQAGGEVPKSDLYGRFQTIQFAPVVGQRSTHAVFEIGDPARGNIDGLVDEPVHLRLDSLLGLPHFVPDQIA